MMALARLLTAGVALLVAGCARLDTNGYYARGGSTGPVHCRGACP